MPMNNDTEQAQKHTPPAPGRVNMSSNTFSPAINLGLVGSGKNSSLVLASGMI
jgi:hypothetical protein